MDQGLMPRFIEDVEFEEVEPLRTPRERDARTVSIIRSAQKSYDLLGIAGRVDDVSREQFESFADRLIRENTAKQAEPAKVAQRVARYSRVLEEERDRSGKRFQTVYAPRGRARDDVPRTVFGTEAWIGRRYFPKTMAFGYVPRFVSRLLALPCVERTVRREVMFARKKAGRGYRVKHRHNRFTDIWC